MRTEPGYSQDPRDFPIAALLGLATWALFAPFALRGIDLHHDGLMFKTALDVAQGKALFRDTFAQYGAFTSWLQGALLWAFGPELRVLKLAAVTSYAATAFLYYLLWRRELGLPPPVAAAAVGVWSLFAYFFDPNWTMLPWSSAFALVVQAGIFFAVARERALLAGLLCGIAYLFRQPVGVAMAGGSLIAFLILSQKARARRAGLLLAGFALILGAFLLRERFAGAWDDWRLQNWDFPRKMADRLGSYRQFGRKLFYNGQLGYPLLAIVPLFAWGTARLRRPWIAIALGTVLMLELLLWGLAPDTLAPMVAPGGWRVFVPVSLALAGLASLPHVLRHLRSRRPLQERDRVALAFVVLGLCSWSQYFPIPCPRHIFWGITPAIGVFAYGLHWLVGERADRTLALLLALFFPAFLHDAGIAYHKLLDREYELVTEGPLRGMRIDLSSREGPRLSEVNRILRGATAAHPEVPVMLETPNALYATLVTNQDQPGPIFVGWPDLRMPAWQDPARERFLAERLPWIVVEDQPDEAIFWLMSRYRYRILYQSEKPTHPESRQVTLLGVDR